MTLTHFLETNSRALTLLQDYSFFSLSLACLLTSLLGWFVDLFLLIQMVWMPSPFIGMDGTLEKHENIMLEISR